MENYRREVQELINKLKNSGVEISAIATHLEVAVSAIYSWLNGSRNIKMKYLKKLRALAEGKLVGAVHEPKIGYTTDNEILLELKTKLDFLIDQNVGLRVGI